MKQANNTAGLGGPGRSGASAARTCRLLQRYVLVCLLLLPSQSAWTATAIQIIGHPSSTASITSMKLLKNIFKRRIRVDSQGRAYVPVNLPVDHPLRKTFSAILFGQQPEAMEHFWNEQYFKGISPPFVLSSQEAVKRFVASTPGALGYILDCQADEHTKVLFTILLKADQADKLSSQCESISR